jgi:putative hydrolase of the HAD superfamily
MTLASERRAARERALGLLYEAEAKGVDGGTVLAALPVPPQALTTTLVEAVDAHRARVDDLLERFAEGWTLARMPALDRAVLRLGAAELIARRDVPTAVVLNEAVELASRFSTEGSGRFVNGLLARVAREVRAAEEVPDAGRSAAGGDEAATLGEPTGERQVDGLVVDLDGVIRHWDPAHIPAVEERLGLPSGSLGPVAFAEDRLDRAMDGRLPFEAWCAEIGDELASGHGADAGAVAEAWAEAGWDIDLEMVDLVAEVRRVVPVALLSNASTRLAADLERSGLGDAFDAVVGSADLRAAKPSRAAFAAAAGAIGVPLERCLFVDDTVGHVEAARALGMRAAVFEGADALRDLLRDLAVLP